MLTTNVGHGQRAGIWARPASPGRRGPGCPARRRRRPPPARGCRGRTRGQSMNANWPTRQTQGTSDQQEQNRYPWQPIPAPGNRRNPKTSSMWPTWSPAYYTVQPDPDDIDQQVAFGTSGHRGLEPGRRVQRGAHPGDHAGDRRVPRRAGHHRPAVHRPRHPRRCPSRPGCRRWRCWPPTTLWR